MKRKHDIHRQVVESMVTAVVVLNHKLCIDYINSAAESLLHASSAHAANQPLRELILLDEAILQALNEALQDGQSFTERDATIHLPDNVSKHVDFTVIVIETAPGTTGLLLELQPLNRLKRINEDDESVIRQETAQHLIRGLAHEVKNPLGGIRGAAQLLEQELRDFFAAQNAGTETFDDLQEYTSVIISEADRLKSLVDRMLGPQRQLKFEPFNMLKVTEYVIALMEAENPGVIDWRRDYDPSLPDIDGDEAQIIQAVMNIVRNACESLQNTEHPTIQIRSRADRQFTIGNVRHRLVMRLDITDNGPGIEQSLLQRIFFPMISGRDEGSGLGLSITQNVISQHHGSIQVNSKPGSTCFSVYLPFEHTLNTAAQEALVNA